MDDELDRLKPVGLPVDMQHWNIEDLNAQHNGLEGRNCNVEKIVCEKSKVQMATSTILSSRTRFSIFGLLLARTWERHHPVWNGKRRGVFIDRKASILVVPRIKDGLNIAKL